jgi:hypothetical protein
MARVIKLRGTACEKQSIYKLKESQVKERQVNSEMINERSR